MSRTDMIYSKTLMYAAMKGLNRTKSSLRTKQINIIATITRVLAALSECNTFVEFKANEGHIGDPNMVSLTKGEFDKVICVFHEFHIVNALDWNADYLYEAVQKAYKGFLELLSDSERQVNTVRESVLENIDDSSRSSSSDPQVDLLFAYNDAVNLCNYLNDWDYYIYQSQRMVYWHDHPSKVTKVPTANKEHSIETFSQRLEKVKDEAMAEGERAKQKPVFEGLGQKPVLDRETLYACANEYSPLTRQMESQLDVLVESMESILEALESCQTMSEFEDLSDGDFGLTENEIARVVDLAYAVDCSPDRNSDISLVDDVYERFLDILDTLRDDQITLHDKCENIFVLHNKRKPRETCDALMDGCETLTEIGHHMNVARRMIKEGIRSTSTTELSNNPYKQPIKDLWNTFNEKLSVKKEPEPMSEPNMKYSTVHGKAREVFKEKEFLGKQKLYFKPDPGNDLGLNQITKRKDQGPMNSDKRKQIMDRMRGLKDKMFSKVSNVSFDLTTNQIGISGPDGFVTFQTDGDGAYKDLKINPMDLLTMDVPAFAMWSPITKLEPGDIVCIDTSRTMRKTAFVILVDGKALSGVEANGSRFTIEIPSNELLGGSGVLAVKNFIGNHAESDINPMMMMAMMGGESGFDDSLGMLLAMQSMKGGENSNFMPMMMMSMMNSGGENDSMRTMMMMSMMQGGESGAMDITKNPMMLAMMLGNKF